MTHHWGYVGAVASALLFGIGATLNKIAVADVNPTIVAGLTYLFAGVALALIRLFPFARNRLMRMLKTPTQTESTFCKRDLLVILFVVISGSTLAPLLYLNGLSGSTAVNASLLLNAESLFTVLIAVAFLGERAKRKDWLGAVFLVLGAVFVTTNAQFSSLTLSQTLFGNVLIIGACLFWGIDNNLSKLLCFKEDLILITAAKCLLGGAALLVLSFALNFEFYVPLSALPYLMIVGIFSIGLSILFFMLGLREIGSLRTGVIYSTSSLFGAFFAFVVLREGFSVIQMLAGILMVMGVYVLYRK
jgi:drug/metabolite transporter (DMT)-like permease